MVDIGIADNTTLDAWQFKTTCVFVTELSLVLLDRKTTDDKLI